MLRRGRKDYSSEWGAWHIKGYNEYCKNYWHNGQEFEALCGVLESVAQFFDMHMDYNPPSDPESKAEYDAGWNKAKRCKIKRVLEGVGGIFGAHIELNPPKS